MTIPIMMTGVLGLDCEMVGVGRNGAVSALARVSIVNEFGYPIYDKFVCPREEVTDYRTACSGIRPENLVYAPQFTDVQAEVAKILKDCIVVGHDLSHDFKALELEHPEKLIRDTSKHKPFIEAFANRTPSLKNLTARFFGENIQNGEHNSVKDAWAAVRLYKMHSSEKWEEGMRLNHSSGTITASSHGIRGTPRPLMDIEIPDPRVPTTNIQDAKPQPEQPSRVFFSPTLDFLLLNYPVLLGSVVGMALMLVLMAVWLLAVGLMVAMPYLIALGVLGFIVFCSWKMVEFLSMNEHTIRMGNQDYTETSHLLSEQSRPLYTGFGARSDIPDNPDKPYKCDECNRRFKTPRKVMGHKNLRHGFLYRRLPLG